MALAPEWFQLSLAAGFEVGQRVTFVKDADRAMCALEHGRGGPVTEGEGVIELIWLALDEEAVKVRTDDGDLVNLFPFMTDIVEAASTQEKT